MRYLPALGFLCILILFPFTVQSTVIHVPGDSPTIQGGIDIAAIGDTVLVAPGTYVENIDFIGKAITVRSDQGAEVTVIDGNQQDHVVSFSNGEGPDSKIEGFTLTNGHASLGGGIYCETTHPTIANNIIVDNEADIGGGGIMCQLVSSPTIYNNVIARNRARNNGGGIYCNTNSLATITNCTIVDNEVWYTGMIGGGIRSRENAYPPITNCIVWGNIPDGIAGLARVTYSDVQDGWAGIGNIEADPRFIGGDPYDYHLLGVSPCIDSGDPFVYDSCRPPGLGEQRSDMGAYGGVGNCGWGPFEPTMLFLGVLPDSTVFPRGGELGFLVSITNNVDDTLCLDGWTDVTLPSGRLISPEGGPLPFIIGPLHTIDLHVSRDIPPGAPVGGPYTYCVNIGLFPDSTIAKNCFEFDVVLPLADGSHLDKECYRH